MKIEKIEETKEYFKGKISVEVTQPRIDIINEVVYAQYFGNGTRSLHMTIFMPIQRKRNLVWSIFQAVGSPLPIMASGADCVWRWH